jgi:hypothetical protein
LEVWRSWSFGEAGGTSHVPEPQAMFEQTKDTENMLSSARKHVTEHLASDMAGSLEKLELCCSEGAGNLQELELWRSWRHIRCAGTLSNVRSNQSHRKHVI